jgi:hypothetical protein
MSQPSDVWSKTSTFRLEGSIPWPCAVAVSPVVASRAAVASQYLRLSSFRSSSKLDDPALDARLPHWTGSPFSPMMTSYARLDASVFDAASAGSGRS